MDGLASVHIVFSGFYLHIGHNGLLGEEIVTSTVGKLVPAVSGTDQDVLRDLIHDMADVGVELGSGQVTTVQGLGTDSDGVNDVLVTGNGLLNGGPIGREGRLGKQVVGIGGLANPIQQKTISKVSIGGVIATYHMPRTTLKPLFLAAGRMF